MGAGARGNDARRILDKLPEELNVPIVRVLLGCYEDGNGTLSGAWLCVPRGILEKLSAFLERLQIDQTAQWKRYEDAWVAQNPGKGARPWGLLDGIVLPDGKMIKVPEDELELIEQFLLDIDDELFRYRRNEVGHWIEESKTPSDRVIDGGTLHL